MQQPERKRLEVASPVQVIAVTGGKGGTGKTSVAVNLATALAQMGRATMLLDGDLGLANVDVMLGLAPRYTLEHVLNGERTLEEVIVQTSAGVRVVPASSGVAGIGEPVLQFCKAAQQVLVVLRDEPTSFTDTYALIKVLSRDHGVSQFRVVTNMTRQSDQGQGAFRRLQRVCDRYLEVVLDHAGDIPEDFSMQKAIQVQRPVLEVYPSSPAAQAIKRLARAAHQWPMPAGPSGRLEFFMERMLTRSTPKLKVLK